MEISSSMQSPERKKEYQKAYALKHKERLKVSQKAYYSTEVGIAKRKAYEETEAYLITILIGNAKKRARDKGMEFSITREDITIPDRCPILGLKLSRNKHKVGPTSISLDRLDSTKGYIKGNVQIISFLANTMKSSATPEQLLTFANWVNNNVKV